MRGWSIAVRVVALLLGLAVLAGVALSALLYAQARGTAEQVATAESRALAIAIADDPTVRAGATGHDPASDLRGLTARLLADSGADFITIMAPDGTRWTHPAPDQVGGTYLGTREPALEGEVWSETFTGTLGPSVRTIAPVLDDDGDVRGLVAAGITVENVTLDATRDLPLVLGLGAVVLAVGALCAVALGRYLRRITLGLGPTELRQVHDLYDAALHNTDEGLVLVDARGDVQLVNDRAGELLGIGPEVGDGLPRPVDELGLPASVAHLAASGRTVVDEHHVTSDRTLVVSQRPASEGRVLLLRDSTELMHLSGQLRGTQAMATALRAQTHEHANRMHTTVSLLELGREDEARRFAADDLARSRRIAGGDVTALDEPFVSALLVSKSAEARDRGVRVDLVVAGDVGGLRLPSVDLVTVVGNLVDNAVDAAEGSAEATVEVEFSRLPTGLRIRVADTGPGLGGADGRRSAAALFALGRTGKAAGSEGRGLGLALVRHTVQRLGGTVEAYDDEGAVFVVEIPPGEEAGR